MMMMMMTPEHLKMFVWIPNSWAKKLFKCPIRGPFQVIRCPHPWAGKGVKCSGYPGGMLKLWFDWYIRCWREFWRGTLLNRQNFVLLLLWTLSSMFLRQGGRWSNKTGNILTDLCLDVFRFLSLTMKVNLSG